MVKEFKHTRLAPPTRTPTNTPQIWTSRSILGEGTMYLIYLLWRTIVCVGYYRYLSTNFRVVTRQPNPNFWNVHHHTELMSLDKAYTLDHFPQQTYNCCFKKIGERQVALHNDVTLGAIPRSVLRALMQFELFHLRPCCTPRTPTHLGHSGSYSGESVAV